MKAISVIDRGSFFVGGFTQELHGLRPYKVQYFPDGALTLMNPNGTFQVGQMYVQFTKVSAQNPYSTVFIHGGGMTGATWETTPDGRPGWDSLFLQKGYDVYIVDSVERGRSGWARYPEINSSEPIFRSYESVWPAFRFGHVYPLPFPNLRFPYKSYSTFMKQIVPRWSTSNEWKQNAFNEFFLRLREPCIVVAHSSGAIFALHSALKLPSTVKALVLIEPASIPNLEKDNIDNLAKIPHLVIWGDYFHEENGGPIPKTIYNAYHSLWPTYLNIIRDCNGDVTSLELPQLNIHGNSHMIMMDDNSEEIAKLIFNWLAQKGLQPKI